MSSPIAPGHLAKATANAAARSFLNGGQSCFNDWKVIVDFYEAVHWIEVYLRATQPALPPRRDHAERQIDVRRYLALVLPAYDSLYWASRAFRYTPRRAADSDVTIADEQLDVIRSHIKRSLGIA